MSEKYPKLDEKKLNEMSRVNVKLPKIDEPIQPEIVHDDFGVCSCGNDTFKMHDKAGYVFSHCKKCGQRYYRYRGY